MSLNTTITSQSLLQSFNFNSLIPQSYFLNAASQSVDSNENYEYRFLDIYPALNNAFYKIKAGVSNWFNQASEKFTTDSLIDSIKKEASLNYGLLSESLRVSVYPISPTQPNIRNISDIHRYTQQSLQQQADFNRNLANQQYQRQTNDYLSAQYRHEGYQRQLGMGTYHTFSNNNTHSSALCYCCFSCADVVKIGVSTLAAGGIFGYLIYVKPIIVGPIVGGIAAIIGGYCFIPKIVKYFSTCRDNGFFRNNQPPPPPPAASV